MKHVLPILALLVSCATGGGTQPNPQEAAIAFLRAIGDVVVRMDGTDALRKYAPQSIPLLDTDKDGVVSLAEVEAAVANFTSDPTQLTFLLIMVREIAAKH